MNITSKRRKHDCELNVYLPTLRVQAVGDSSKHSPSDVSVRLLVCIVLARYCPNWSRTDKLTKQNCT
jgi:hypothetical protein